MSIYAIADLHLAISVPNKSMEDFGKPWENYIQRMEAAWKERITKEDLVLIPGDISWAKTLEEAAIDLAWIEKLPGTKLLLKGNHDYWWSSISKVKKILPPSIHLIQNDVFNWGSVSIGGTRLWDTDEFDYENYIEYVKNDRIRKSEEPDNPEEQEKIFLRELGRLEMSLKQLNPQATLRIALTHYPPIGPLLGESKTAQILERFKIDICLFGHLHNVKKGIPLLGKKNGVEYILTAADYLEFIPKKIY